MLLCNSYVINMKSNSKNGVKILICASKFTIEEFYYCLPKQSISTNFELFILKFIYSADSSFVKLL